MYTHMFWYDALLITHFNWLKILKINWIVQSSNQHEQLKSIHKNAHMTTRLFSNWQDANSNNL